MGEPGINDVTGKGAVLAACLLAAAASLAPAQQGAKGLEAGYS
jgi:hypothetical protein